jgi:nucleotide-binding universal stress UspA family protein
MIHHLLLCTDGSSSAYKAKETACHMYSIFGCKVSVVCVADLPKELKEAEIFKDEETQAIIERYTSGLIAWGKEVLKKAQASMEAKGVKANYYLEKGSPVASIVHFAKVKGVDLIVIGSRGLSEIKSHFIGSVSDGVNHKAPCSVLIVH